MRRPLRWVAPLKHLPDHPWGVPGADREVREASQERDDEGCALRSAAFPARCISLICEGGVVDKMHFQLMHLRSVCISPRRSSKTVTGRLAESKVRGRGVSRSVLHQTDLAAIAPAGFTLHGKQTRPWTWVTVAGARQIPSDHMKMEVRELRREQKFVEYHTTCHRPHAITHRMACAHPKTVLKRPLPTGQAWLSVFRHCHLFADAELTPMVRTREWGW
jgi:hypothetical protein